MLFSFDSCDIEISDRFKPILLKGVTRNGFDSHAYINIIKVGGVAVIYIGWLNVKSHLDERYQNGKMSLAVYANTPNGRVGQFVQKSPKFEDEQVIRHEDGIFLPRHTLYNWAEWASNFKCFECNYKKGHPHVHVRVLLVN